MDNPDHYGLFSANVKKFKPVGSSSTQFIGLCPFHEDSKESFTMTTETGLCNCFSCGYKANAYKFAKDIGHPNPKEFIVEKNGVAHPTASPVVMPPPPIDLEKTMDKLKSNLKNNMDHYPKIWDKKLIDEIGIGLGANNKFHFAHHDENGNIIAIRTHKGKIVGDGRSKWYLRHLIASYDRNKPLYITEGEKDALVLISRGLQAVSGSTGCLSIPKDSNGKYDLEWLKDFAEIYVCYDLDDAGQKGGLKLATEIVKVHPNLNVKIIQLDGYLDKGFDIFDAFMSDGEFGADFFNACLDAVKLEPVIPERFGVFDYISGEDADSMELEETKVIVENILPQGVCSILAGTTGSGKSLLSMSLGMALCNDEDEFIGFKINQKGLSVLYCDTEVGSKELRKRFKKLQGTFAWRELNTSRFNMLSKRGVFADIWDDLKNAVIYLKPDVVFIDCLYNTSTEREFSKSHKIAQITDELTKLKYENNLTVFCVHHMNKGGHEHGLQKDRMSGASALQNWVEHLTLMTETNDESIRLLKIDKSRVMDYPRCYYGLSWDGDRFKFENMGIIENWRHYLVSEEKKVKWKLALETMAHEFTTMEFRSYVECVMKLSKRTADNWLAEMKRCKAIVFVKQGTWEKNLQIFESDVE